MDTVTYPSPAVRETLSARFIPVHLNTVNASAAVQRAMAEFHMLWTPTLIWLDPHGVEIRRQVGYLPPEHFLAELQFVEAQAYLLHGEQAAAASGFRAAFERGPTTPTAPEALYWAGVAGYRASGTFEALTGPWHELKEKFPDSSWWTRASFIG